MKDPQTRDEWQEAANLAHTLLLIDAARFYGLINRGPDIDTDRCEEIIERAQALGITPTRHSCAGRNELIEPLLAELS